MPPEHRVLAICSRMSIPLASSNVLFVLRTWYPVNIRQLVLRRRQHGGALHDLVLMEKVCLATIAM